MPKDIHKVVFAPMGADTCGNDILLFEHGILFALEMAAEKIGLSFADVHDALHGGDKREAPQPPLSQSEIRALAAKAACDVFVDGMLQAARHPETQALAEVAVAPRVFLPADNRFEAPDALLFRSFDPAGAPESLSLDYDLYIALQYRLCESLFASLDLDLPFGFTADTLQIAHTWEAYTLFLKGKRLTQIAEAKLGYYEQAIRKEPDFFLALYNAGMLHKSRTDYHEARNRLMKAASATPDEALLTDVYFELGLCSIYLGDPKTARNFWERALEFGADNPSLYVNMAGTYEQEEKWAEARRLNELAVDRFPDYHKAIVNLARLSAMFGQLDEAIELYERALSLQPNDSLRRSILGGCYLASGRTDEARAQFEQSIALDPTGDPAKYAQQELEKLGSAPPATDQDPEKKKKRWGLW